MTVEPRGKVRTFEKLELIVCFGLSVVGVALGWGEGFVFLFAERLRFFFIKALERMTGASSKDKNAFSDGMGDLAFLEGAVLHGSEEVLQPLEFL